MRISDWSSDVCSSDLNEALVKILAEPKNALVKQYRKLFDMEDVELTFTDDALVSIAKRAIERKTGARGLRSILEAILLDTMFDLPSMRSVGEVVIDKDVVEGRKEPVREIGRAPCRGRVCQYVWISVVAVSLKKKK